MSGRLFWQDKGSRESKINREARYIHVRLRLERGGELIFSDARTFGHFRVLDQEGLQKRLQLLGPEPLRDLTKEKFREILAGSGRKIKDLLLDQRKIAGIGNIYANGALWLAGIYPETPANKISYKISTALHRAVENVLQEALAVGGSSVRSYRHAD